MADAPDRRGAESLPRHLVRGAVGFGALVAAFALLPAFGPAALLLAPVGVLALRGCPTCWVVGLVEVVSRGRLERACADGRCELAAADRPSPARRGGAGP